MSQETFLAKLEKDNTRTFLLPVLQETVTFTKMDVIESALNNDLPNFLANRVLDGMKRTIGGKSIEDQDIVIENNDIKDVLIRATEMWGKKVIDPVLTDEQIVKIPSADRLAWYFNAIIVSQESETEGGGVLNAEEVGNFPVKTTNRRNTKRGSDS